MAGLGMVFQYILCWIVHRIKQRAKEQHFKKLSGNYSKLLTDKAKGLKSKAKLTTTTMEFVSER